MSPWPRVRWHVRQRVDSVGLPGWVALALVLLCAGGLWSVVEPMRGEARRLDEESAALERRWAASAHEDAGAAASPQQQLAAFRQRFPDDRGIASALRLLQAAARRQHVALDQAEFKLASEAAQPLARYSIMFPIKADYRALRRFIRDALRELPALALEDVNLGRSDPKSPTLEAQLRFVLFVTPPSTALPASPAGRSN